MLAFSTASTTATATTATTATATATTPHQPPRWETKLDVKQTDGKTTFNDDLDRRTVSTTKDCVEHCLRQTRLREIQVEGQNRILNAKIIIVGIGGLGSSCLQFLVGSNVGRILLCDFDVVERSNLHRQLIHSESTLGIQKAKSGMARAKELCSFCTCDVFEEKVSEKNVLDLLFYYNDRNRNNNSNNSNNSSNDGGNRGIVDCVIDCTDNLRARYVLSDACAKYKVKLVSGGAIGVEGQLIVYNDYCFIEKKYGPCLRCAYPKPPKQRECGSCADNGVLNVAPGIVGTFQALECIKILLAKKDNNKDEEEEEEEEEQAGFNKRPVGLMTLFDFVQNPSRPTSCVKIPKRADCLVCATEETRDNFSIETYDYDAFINGPSTEKSFCEERGFDYEKNGEKKRITCQELVNSINENNCILFDVRNKNEFAIASLEDSFNYPEIMNSEDETSSSSPPSSSAVLVGTRSEDFENSTPKVEVGEEEKLRLKKNIKSIDRIVFLCRRGNDSQLARERFKKIVSHVSSSPEAKDGNDLFMQIKKDKTTTYVFDWKKCEIVDVFGGLQQWKRSIDDSFPNLD